jgi:hypothetical protein
MISLLLSTQESKFHKMKRINHNPCVSNIKQRWNTSKVVVTKITSPDLRAYPHLHPWQRNITLVRDLSCVRCLQHQPLVIEVTSQKLQSSKTLNNNICKKSVKTHELNLVSHAATRQNAQNTLTTMRWSKACMRSSTQWSLRTNYSVNHEHWAQMGARFARTKGSFLLMQLF